MVQRAWVRATGAVCLTVSLCVCGGEAAVRKGEDPPVQKQLASALQLDAAAAALSLRVDREARDLNAGRLIDPNPREVSLAEHFPRRAFAVSALRGADELQSLETRLDQAIVRAYETAAKADAPSPSALELQTALLHYAVLVRRQSGQSWHTVVPGLMNDPACMGDVIGDQLLARYFFELFSSAKDNRERSVFQLAEIARHTACLGTAQAIQIAGELTGAYAELEAFLRSIGRGDLLPHVANVVAQPLLTLLRHRPVSRPPIGSLSLVLVERGGAGRRREGAPHAGGLGSVVAL